MDILSGFEFYLNQAGRKPRTIRLYLSYLRRVLLTVTPLTKEGFSLFLLELRKQNCKATYINHFILTMRVYAKYANLPDFLTIATFKEAEFVKATMSDDEIEAFLQLPPITGGHKAVPQYNAWTLFFSIMAYTGMRPGEVAHLTIENCDIGRGVFVLPDTKTNTPRFVPIPEIVLHDLEERIKNVTGPYIFPSRRGGGEYRQGAKVFNDQLWSCQFHNRLKRLGIRRTNLSVYSLRHSFITRMLEEDVNIFKVQKIVGHKQLETTAHYTHLTTKDIIKTIKMDRLSRKGLDKVTRLRSFITYVREYGIEHDLDLDVHFSEGTDEFDLKVRFK